EDSPLMPGDRVVAVRGEQPRDAADAMMYATPGLVPHEARVAPPSVALIERDGQRLEVEAAALLEATLWGLQERLTALGGRAQVLRSGGLLERDLPAGIEWRLSAFALAPLPGNRFEGPRELELPRGHYVLLSHRSGHQLVRSYVSVDGLRGRYEIEIEPRPTSFAPEGFVHLSISAPSARWAFWIAEFEVLAKDYLEFLNDPQTRAEVNVAWELGQASRVPRGGGGRFERRTLWPRGSDGLFLLPPEIDPREPVLGISWEDATAYVDWLNRRGGPGRFYLGGEAEHASAGCYAGDRRFSYGARFDQRAANTCFSRPVARPEVVGSHPIDESPLGVYDLCGNAAELIDAWFDKPNGYRYAIGGAWGQAPGEVNRVLGGGGHRPDSTTGETGMRLLWAPDDEATER
ncbi:MAG: SUMF1/EgtB/PvdO family nonheme iron enzyme, partial [Planctomycetota bacterium]